MGAVQGEVRRRDNTIAQQRNTIAAMEKENAELKRRLGIN